MKFRCWSPTSGMWDWEMLKEHDFITLEDLRDRYDPDDGEIEWKVMQYTGLKDKHLKEIYEGDVIRYSNGKHYWKYVIASNDSNGINLFGECIEHNLSVEENEEGETVYTFKTVKTERDSYHKIPEGCEVIGNIWENPELTNR